MRILHTMLRVGDLQRSIDFYTKTMGMSLLRSTERPEQKYSLAFVGYGDESEGAVLELTYNHGVDQLRARRRFRPRRDLGRRRGGGLRANSRESAARSRARRGRSRAGQR